MHVTRMAVVHRVASCDTERKYSFRYGEHEGREPTAQQGGYAGSWLYHVVCAGKLGLKGQP